MGKNHGFCIYAKVNFISLPSPTVVKPLFKLIQLPDYAVEINEGFCSY